MTTTRDAALEAAASKMSGLLSEAFDVIDAPPPSYGEEPIEVRDFRHSAYGRMKPFFDAAIAVRAALSTPATEPQGYVVKPLVWVPEDAPCTRFKAEALGGHMMIVELDPKTDPGRYSAGFDLGGLCFKFVLAEYDDFPPKYTAPAKFDGIEAAKAAAQADYETRIMSAIIGTATPAPSDKIAEAAQVIIAKWDADTKTGLVYGPNEFAVMLRALAGKGE